MLEYNPQNAGRCHWGSRLVFQWEGLNFYGAGSFRGLDTKGMDVIVDCGANIGYHMDTADSKEITQRGKIIRITWPDGGEPEMTEKQWQALIKNFKRIQTRSKKSGLNILVCCVGGHGRTGTALAIFAALTGIAPKSPVEFIRSEYCRRAVETRVQCRYIRKVVGILIAEDMLLSEFDAVCDSSLR